MTPVELAAVRDSLLRLRDELAAEGSVPVRVEDAEPVASKVDEDAAPYTEMNQAIASARNRERTERAARIDDALRRLGDDPDGYGICRVCEDYIDPRRLVLVPFAELCVACQAAEEPKGAHTRKKVTDYR